MMLSESAARLYARMTADELLDRRLILTRALALAPSATQRDRVAHIDSELRARSALTAAYHGAHRPYAAIVADGMADGVRERTSTPHG